MLFVLSMVSVCTMAEEAPFEFSVMGYNEAGDQFKLSANDVQKGVLIQVGHGMAAKHFKAKALIESVLKQNGIKIANAPEEADFGFQIDDVSNVLYGSVGGNGRLM